VPRSCKGIPEGATIDEESIVFEGLFDQQLYVGLQFIFGVDRMIVFREGFVCLR
jgi:hypothetical protein